VNPVPENLPHQTSTKHNNIAATLPAHQHPAGVPCRDATDALTRDLFLADNSGRGAVPLLLGRAPGTLEAICGYAINTDWTASAPILRHSGYRHHHSGHGQS
jgi:hypothetical protein